MFYYRQYKDLWNMSDDKPFLCTAPGCGQVIHKLFGMFTFIKDLRQWMLSLRGFFYDILYNFEVRMKITQKNLEKKFIFLSSISKFLKIQSNMEKKKVKSCKGKMENLEKTQGLKAFSFDHYWLKIIVNCPVGNQIHYLGWKLFYLLYSCEIN